MPPASPAKRPWAIRPSRRVVTLTCAEPPGEATHWTGRAMAKAAGSPCVRCSASGGPTTCSRTASGPSSSRPTRVRRQARGHRRPVRRPAQAAVVLSVDEKSPDPGARPNPARPAAQAGQGRDDDPRLQAPRHHHPVRRARRPRRQGARPLHAAPPAPEFLRFLRDRGRRAGRQADPRDPRQLCCHKAPKVKRWLARHPRFHLHFTPTSASWPNAVEGFFGAHHPAPQARQLPLGPRAPAAIDDYIAQHNADPKPFVWTRPSTPSSLRSPLNAPVHLCTRAYSYCVESAPVIRP